MAFIRSECIHKGDLLLAKGVNEIARLNSLSREEVVKGLNDMVNLEMFDIDDSHSEIYPNFKMTTFGELSIYNPEMLEIYEKDIELYISSIERCSISDLIARENNPYDYCLRLCLSNSSTLLSTDKTILRQAIVQLIEKHK